MPMPCDAVCSSIAADRALPEPAFEQSQVVPTLTACLPHARRFLRARLAPGSGLDVDDLLQEAFLRAFTRLPHLRFHSRGEVLGYLKRVAWNLVLDEHRRTARRPPVAPLEDRVASREPSPIDGLLARERRSLLKMRLSRLRPELRRALLLRITGRCDANRLAELIGRRTPGAARVALSRALEAVRSTPAARPPRTRGLRMQTSPSPAAPRETRTAY